MQTLTRANRELFRRGADESYPSLTALWDHCYKVREQSTDHWYPPQSVHPKVEGTELMLALGGDQPFRFNDWSFSQMCRLASVAKDTLNPELAQNTPPARDFDAHGMYVAAGARKEKQRERSWRKSNAHRPYVELRCASAFSFLDGASLPEDLVCQAAELGLPAMALIDTNGVYGAPRFHQAAKEAGLRALVGAEVTLDRAGDDLRLTLLVEDRAGYRNLCRLLTSAAFGPGAFLLDGGLEQRLLGGEVPVEAPGAGGQAHPALDLGDRGALEPLLGEEVEGGLEDSLPRARLGGHPVSGSVGEADRRGC